MKQQSTSKLSKQNTTIQTIDGPPLDFSFKNIRSLHQLIQNMPATNLVTQNSQQKAMTTTLNFASSPPQVHAGNITKNNSNINNSSSTNVAKSQQEKEVAEQPKLQIIRTIETSDLKYMQSQHKKITAKKENNQKKVKKIISPQVTSLFLRYNKITSIQNFVQLVEPVFPNLINNLMWVDLSHNRLTQLSEDLGSLKQLKTLYLHANYLSNFAELDKLKKASLLRTLTIHANPLQQFGEFRVLISSILPTLKKIDSTLLTKRQSQRAQVLMKSMKKYPTIKNVKKPVEESQNQQQDQ